MLVTLFTLVACNCGFRFLGAFAKLRKATIRFVMSVRLSAWTQLVFHWKAFHGNWYVSIYRKLVEKIGISLTLRRLMSYIYGAPILDVSRSHTTTQHRR